MQIIIAFYMCMCTDILEILYCFFQACSSVKCIPVDPYVVESVKLTYLNTFSFCFYDGTY